MVFVTVFTTTTLPSMVSVSSAVATDLKSAIQLERLALGLYLT